MWAFALMFGFQLLMLVLYPKLILPLFNKLTPLPEGELRERLLALGERTGFHAQTIEVIDASATDVATRVRELTSGKGADIVFKFSLSRPFLAISFPRGQQIWF